MQPPRLPATVRTLNRVGSGVRALGIPLGRLDADALVARSRKRTGLDDFGDQALGGASLADGLGRLVQSLEEEARLSPLGRYVALGELSRYLADRLQLLDWHRRHPEIAQGEVRRPIFIVGQGRTGTTMLHELMALDPSNRVPITWEVDAPCPPPARETFESDPRIEASQAQLDGSERLIPDFKRMHRMGAQLPQECVRITGSAFASFIFAAQWRVPSYVEWLIHEAPMAPVYAYHRRFLQLLQWRCPAERWVLKSPGHLWSLDAVLAEYPDACFVQTHRDPLKILSSLTSLELVLRTMTSDAGSAQEIAREWSRWNEVAYERSVAFRESGKVDESRIVDVHFGDFIRDPVAVVARIYSQFGLRLSPELEQRMRDYVAANPSDRDGKHEHAFSDTGLDPEAERAKVERYQAYFDVVSEPVA